MNSLYFILSVLVTLCHGVPPRHQPFRNATICENWRSILDEAGKTIFIAGNRNHVMPQNLAEADNFCAVVQENSNIIRDIARLCLKPFPKQIIGTYMYGVRKMHKRVCNDLNEKNRIIEYCKCMLPQPAQKLLHDMGDDFTMIIEAIRDDGYDINKQIPLVCCQYQEFRQKIRVNFAKYCSDEALEFTLDTLNSMIEDALDLLCYQHMSHTDAKCVKLSQDYPVLVRKNATRQSEGFFLPLTDIYVAVGEVPT